MLPPVSVAIDTSKPNVRLDMTTSTRDFDPALMVAFGPMLWSAIQMAA